MGFLHFHEIKYLSGMNISAPYKIDIVKGCGFCNGKIMFIWQWFFYNRLIVILDDGNIYLIFYFYKS